MKVSVIIPVFNAAGSLPGALESLEAQTFRDFEVVFVDDASTDASPALIEAFRTKSGIPCKVIRQEVNKGVATARNQGLKVAEGTYLAFLDADDKMEPEALQRAVETAEADGADIVGWDWTLGFDTNGRYMRQADYDTPLQALKHLMEGTMRWNLWLFLTRRSLLTANAIRFIDGANMGEDMMVMLRAFSCAGKVRQMHRSLYRYNAVNTASISRQFSEARRKEITENFEMARRYLLSGPYADALAPAFPHLQLFLKRPLLISAKKEDYRTWQQWFPEANRFATENKALPFHTRLLQGMAARGCWTGVKLYYLCVYKVVYGLIYR